MRVFKVLPIINNAKEVEKGPLYGRDWKHFLLKLPYEKVKEEQLNLVKEDGWQILDTSEYKSTEDNEQAKNYQLRIYKNGHLFVLHIEGFKVRTKIKIVKLEPTPYKIGDTVKFMPPPRYIAEAKVSGPPLLYVGKVKKVIHQTHIVVDHPSNQCGGWPWHFFTLIKRMQDGKISKL